MIDTLDDNEVRQDEARRIARWLVGQISVAASGVDVTSKEGPLISLGEVRGLALAAAAIERGLHRSDGQGEQKSPFDRSGQVERGG